jgi:hypothetical protein
MRIKRSCTILLLLSFVYGLGIFTFFAQDLEENEGNSELYRIAFYGTEKEDHVITYQGNDYFVAIGGIDPYIAGRCVMATSMLAAEGTPPTRPSFIIPDHEWELWIEFADNDEEIRKCEAYLEWVEMYSPKKVSDSDPGTCWVEGRPGFGRGEILLVYIEGSTHIKIWAGFGRSEKLYYQNNRPKQINVYVLEALDVSVNQYAETFGNLVVLGKRKVTLEDKNGFQFLPLPRFDKLSKQTSLFLAIEILSVYPGTVYDDTCISEIKVGH